MGQEGESACVIEGVETREGLCSQMVSWIYKDSFGIVINPMFTIEDVTMHVFIIHPTS